MYQKVELSSSVPKSSSETVSRVIPAPISHRGPIRSDSRPANGATRMISTVIGRNVAPVSIAL